MVFSDELNHASIIDGCRLSRAESFVYRHLDTEHLAWGLRKARGRAALIVTDGVFSMDGDVAPLRELADLARRHGCRLMVDEAHATGCIGPGGRGSVADAGVGEEVDVVMGTLGKALGSYGAYVCGSRELIDYLVNRARSLIFSTALPPSAVAAAGAALDLLTERPRRVERLQANAEALRECLRDEGLEPGGAGTQIVPLVMGEAANAMALCERLIELGVFGQAIRPPTVPPGTSRLRLTAMATHRVGELRQAARLIGGAMRELDLAAPNWPPEAGQGRVMQGVFVTGTGTEVGKTVVAAAIARSAARPGRRVAVFKPAVSGLDELNGVPADHELLRSAAGSDQPDDEVAPYRYGAPVSPHLAAQLAGEEIERAQLLLAADHAMRHADVLVCEGVGGFLVPLNRSYLVRDLAADLRLPVVIAAQPGLGTINHTLLTIEAVRAAGLEVASVVLTPWPDWPRELERSNRATIAELGEVPVKVLPRLDLSRPASWPRLDLGHVSSPERVLRRAA